MQTTNHESEDRGAASPRKTHRTDDRFRDAASSESRQPRCVSSCRQEGVRRSENRDANRPAIRSAEIRVGTAVRRSIHPV
jgi:hypothetical protein